MAKELKGVHSLIGQALAPDFSKEKDLGDALYSHMQNLSGLIRGTLIASDLNNDGNLGDVHELLELFVDGFENGLGEFDEQRTGRNHAAAVAAKVSVAKIGKARKVA